MDLNQIFGMRPGINDTNPPTMADKFSTQNPNVVNQWQLQDLHNQEKMLRLRLMLMKLQQQYPYMDKDTLLRKAFTEQSWQDSTDMSNSKKEWNTNFWKGKTF